MLRVTKWSTEGMNKFLAAAIVGALGWLVYSNFIATDYSKPWFEGERSVRICKIPYYDDSECMGVVAKSDGNSISQITTPSGHTFSTFDNVCHEAASFSGHDRFCRFREYNGQTWDVLP